MVGECNGCGSCCDPVMMGMAQHDVVTMLPSVAERRFGITPEDYRWIRDDLVPMPRREGLAKSPWLTQGGTTMAIIQGEPVMMLSLFYSCRRFDPVERRCTDYDNRPPICRTFPYMDDGMPIDAKTLPHWCGYREDAEPVPVELLPRSACG